jgi:hypothetical protein
MGLTPTQPQNSWGITFSDSPIEGSTAVGPLFGRRAFTAAWLWAQPTSKVLNQRQFHPNTAPSLQSATDMDESTEDTDSENFSECSEPFTECLICGDLNSGWDSEFVQTDDFVASANGKCSVCEMLLKGLSLVTDIQLVTKLRFDYDAALQILYWDNSDFIASYEFYISSSGMALRGSTIPKNMK